MPETTDLVSKILPRSAIHAPAVTITVACTDEEIASLALSRLKSVLEKHGANYFTVDDFHEILSTLLSGRYYPHRLTAPSLKYLEEMGRVVIVPFSPTDIYRIVDEPLPNP